MRVDRPLVCARSQNMRRIGMYAAGQRTPIEHG